MDSVILATETKMVIFNKDAIEAVELSKEKEKLKTMTVNTMSRQWSFDAVSEEDVTNFIQELCTNE